MRLAIAWKPEKHRLLVSAGRSLVQVKPVSHCFRGQKIFQFMFPKIFLYLASSNPGPGTILL
jgi:hypothetical protein